MSSTNMLKQIKARREVSMFASQPQANGTNYLEGIDPALATSSFQ